MYLVSKQAERKHRDLAQQVSPRQGQYNTSVYTCKEYFRSPGSAPIIYTTLDHGGGYVPGSASCSCADTTYLTLWYCYIEVKAHGICHSLGAYPHGFMVCQVVVLCTVSSICSFEHPMFQTGVQICPSRQKSSVQAQTPQCPSADSAALAADSPLLNVAAVWTRAATALAQALSLKK